MIDICTECGEVAEVETWGNNKFCKKCAQGYKEYHPETPPNGMDIKIKGPRIIAGAGYNPSTGEMEIFKAPREMSRLFMWISHEFTHYILHDLVGLRCCYQYDSIAPHGEIHSELFGVEEEQ